MTNEEDSCNLIPVDCDIVNVYWDVERKIFMVCITMRNGSSEYSTVLYSK
jgi:hypothetical protein